MQYTNNLKRLAQNSNAYEAARSKYIVTASNVPNIFGYGYKSRKKYYEELVAKIHEGREKSPEPSSFVSELMEEGKKTEPIAASTFEELYGIRLIPTGLWEHPEYNWLAASPDRGIFTDYTHINFPNESDKPDSDGPFGTIVEIKCRTQGAPPYTPSDEQFIKFWLQMQVQMQCTRSNYCIYWGYSNYSDVPAELHVIPRDDKQWPTIIYKIQEFIAWVRAKTPPPPRCSKIKFDINTMSFSDWLKKNPYVYNKIKELQ